MQSDESSTISMFLLCVCVGLSINEIINIMFYYSFYLLSFFYLLNLPINVVLVHLSLLSHSHILFLNANIDFYKYISTAVHHQSMHISSNFLRWLVITIRYKVVFLLCIIMLKILVKLTEYNAI